MWLESLSLTNFRNHAHVQISAGPHPVVLWGPNGAGKTNILEAVSLTAPGQGLRRASYPDLARHGGHGDWAVAAKLNLDGDVFLIGTGQAAGGKEPQSGRIVRIDGAAQSGSGVLADYVDMIWLTPAQDSLFTGPASERRRFLDRLVLCSDPGHRTRASQFERAMRQRNKLLSDGVRSDGQFTGLERIMAETGVAIAAARRAAVAMAQATITERRETRGASPFPWAVIELEGTLEEALGEAAAVDVEDTYAEQLARLRERDRTAGRTTQGPHRSDLIVRHGPKDMPARLCSTGEQKALLVGLVLANADMLRRRGQTGRDTLSAIDRGPPILLLDEVAAHLDAHRREALFDELLALGAQAWMTGTDAATFAPLAGQATITGVAPAE